MSRYSENTAFTCDNCGKTVQMLTNGSYRNHCPFCLYSKHLDNKPGDRKSICRGLMRPIRVQNKSGKGMQIVHKCVKCGIEKPNKIAEYGVQPDSIEEIIKLM